MATLCLLTGVQTSGALQCMLMSGVLYHRREGGGGRGGGGAGCSRIFLPHSPVSGNTYHPENKKHCRLPNPACFKE